MHLSPQAEQLLVVPSATSQPSVSLLLLQSAKPGLQVPLQRPAAHVGLAMLLFEHFLPHPPQLLASVSELTSQPSLRFMLQSRKPAVQPQAPAVQVMLFPQVPQFATVRAWPQLSVPVAEPQCLFKLLQNARSLSGAHVVRSGIARSGPARSSVAKSKTARSGCARSGIARSGIARSGVAKSGIARSGIA